MKTLFVMLYLSIFLFFIGNLTLTGQEVSGNQQDDKEINHQNNGIYKIFVPVQKGTFMMGSNVGEDDERPVHSVLVNSFSISKYETTVGEFRAFMENTDYKTTAEINGGSWGYEYKWRKISDLNWQNPYFDQTKEHPVTCISWYDAIAYCNWMSKEDGLTPVYSTYGENVTWNREANGYRLPTEAEWEYAARGGKLSKGYTHSGGSTMKDLGWYKQNSNGQTNLVGSKKANELGIHDMSGNVWEWCWDWKGKYQSGSQIDIGGPASGSGRIVRGGSYHSLGAFCRSTNRVIYKQLRRNNYTGFRVVRTL